MTEKVGVRTRVNRAITERRVHHEYEQAREEASVKGGHLCGVYLEGGKPAYFVMPAGASDEEIQNRAFELRNGRPIGSAELTLLRLAKQRLERE